MTVQNFDWLGQSLGHQLSYVLFAASQFTKYYIYHNINYICNFNIVSYATHCSSPVIRWYCKRQRIAVDCRCRGPTGQLATGGEVDEVWINVSCSSLILISILQCSIVNILNHERKLNITGFTQITALGCNRFSITTGSILQ